MQELSQFALGIVAMSLGVLSKRSSLDWRISALIVLSFGSIYCTIFGTDNVGDWSIVPTYLIFTTEFLIFWYFAFRATTPRVDQKPRW